MPPTEVVSLLNGVFSTFDYLAQQHGVEKIRTIGDSYFLAGGVPVVRDDHADAIADMALDMQAEIQNFSWPNGEPLQLRIGINTGGPVVGAVIGIQKFAYDVWGNDVNLASRMESQGEPGRIQVSAATYERLRDRYQFEKRGEIEIKGKGVMTTYWLLDRQR
jgi:adenylate cyclase